MLGVSSEGEELGLELPESEGVSSDGEALGLALPLELGEAEGVSSEGEELGVSSDGLALPELLGDPASTW